MHTTNERPSRTAATAAKALPDVEALRKDPDPRIALVAARTGRAIRKK